MSAQRFAVATETDVFPTPPLPVSMMSLMSADIGLSVIYYCMRTRIVRIEEMWCRGWGSNP